jgi:predicted SAM-dependent methyltransferase
MNNPANFNVFELDDHPLDDEYTISIMRRFKRVNRAFKANLFCVPELMTQKHIGDLMELPFVRIYPHGFEHAQKECHVVDDSTFVKLDRLRDSEVFNNIFKAPRYGYSPEFLHALAERGMVAAINTLHRIDEIPQMRTYERRSNELAGSDRLQHCLRHCRYPDGRAFGRPVANGSRSSINRRFVLEYCRYLKNTKLPFAFCEDLTQHSQVKINIGCGPHHFSDWLNLDHRPSSPTVRQWDLSQPIPCTSNRADLAYSSHVLNYVDDYEKLFLEVWRVLRPGKIYRLEEDDTDSGYVWRQAGKRHVTGKIRSEPTKRSVIESLERVGFEVKEVPFDESESKHREVLSLHTRHRRYKRGQKFILEATKAIEIKDVNRPYRCDHRAPRRGEYPYKLKGIQNDYSGIAQDVQKEN